MTLPTLFYICNDPERALGLDQVLPNYHIVCIDNSPLIPLMRDNGIKVFSLGEEQKDANLLPRNSAMLLKNQSAREYISANTPEGTKPNVIFFKISPRLEKLASLLDYNVLNTSSVLNRLFENKLSQFKELSNLDVGFPKQELIRLGHVSYDALSRSYGSNIVIQFDRGHTGNGTTFITNESEYRSLVQEFEGRDCRIAQFIEGEAWTINACATKFGTLHHGLSHQITGIPELTSQKGGTVGNDWSRTSELDETTIKRISEVTNTVGDDMVSKGYLGLFGLDFIIDFRGFVYLIEINARQPASTGMHTQLMLKSELTPLMLFHLAEHLYETDNDKSEFLNEVTKSDKSIKDRISEIQDSMSLPIEASQTIIRNTKKISIKVKTKRLQMETTTYQVNKLDVGESQYIGRNPNQLISPGDEVGRIQSLDGESTTRALRVLKSK